MSYTYYQTQSTHDNHARDRALVSEPRPTAHAVGVPGLRPPMRRGGKWGEPSGMGEVLAEGAR